MCLNLKACFLNYSQSFPWTYSFLPKHKAQRQACIFTLLTIHILSPLCYHRNLYSVDPSSTISFISPVFLLSYICWQQPTVLSLFLFLLCFLLLGTIMIIFPLFWEPDFKGICPTHSVWQTTSCSYLRTENTPEGVQFLLPEGLANNPALQFIAADSLRARQGTETRLTHFLLWKIFCWWKQFLLSLGVFWKDDFKDIHSHRGELREEAELCEKVTRCKERIHVA